jgi:cytochrome c551/c552
MDPHRNHGLNNAKLQAILQSQNTSSRTSSETDDMPAPPAYYSVVDPMAPIPNVHNPYDAEEEHDKGDDEETPEVTINAATQIRGNGNIISIAQMDSVRIATLVATMLKGEHDTEPTTPSTQSPHGQTLPSLASMTSLPRPVREYPRVNITVNCGATVIGDRNIVGPGLGDIARQMQMAQRNQAALAQQQQQAAQNQRASPAVPTTETVSQAQAGTAQQSFRLFGMHAPTPPLSRSSSLQSEGMGYVKANENGAKRKAGDGAGEGGVKKKSKDGAAEGDVKKPR